MTFELYWNIGLGLSVVLGLLMFWQWWRKQR